MRAAEERKSVATPTIESAIQFNVESPILDVNGNSFFVSGFEHLIDGTEDLTRPAHAAISAPTAAVNLSSQIAANRADQIVGLGGEPSVGTVDAIDLDTLVEQAKAAATDSLEPGTHSQLSRRTRPDLRVIESSATAAVVSAIRRPTVSRVLMESPSLPKRGPS